MHWGRISESDYACRFDPQTTQYQPYGKDWVKTQIYEQLKKQVGIFSHSCQSLGPPGGELNLSVYRSYMQASQGR